MSEHDRPVTGHDLWKIGEPARKAEWDAALAREQAIRRDRDRYDSVTSFELTEDHVKLLRRMYVGWSYSETGAPEINPKRPYGDSSVAGDVMEILGWPMPSEEDYENEAPIVAEMNAKALRIHREMGVALAVVLRTGSFEPGLYQRPDPYGQEWARVDEDDARGGPDAA